MIADLDLTIEQLLIAELPINNGEIDIKFEQPKREWSARLARPTLNFFLYDVRENNLLRQHDWERVTSNSQISPRDRIAIKKRLPFRLDCHYMMTAWASEPGDEHRLLSRAMLTLFRTPYLPDEHLIGEMKEQSYRLTAQLARHDKLTNPAELWGALDNEIRPSISFLITIEMDPWTEISSPIIQTFEFRTHQQDGSRERRPIPESMESTIHIGGIVRQNGDPQAGMEVVVKSSGDYSITDAEGKFIFAHLTPGDYTLVVTKRDGATVERQVKVPAKEYDIEI